MNDTNTTKNAQRLNLRYQERIACLTEMMDKLKQKETYDLSDIFKTVFEALNEMIIHLHAGAIIGIKEDQLTFFTSQNLITPNKYWASLSSNEKGCILAQLNSELATKDVIYWNYETNAPVIFDKKNDEKAIAISFLCKYADDENLFMIIYRNTLKKPLLSDEVQLIKMVSRILGWHLNYEFTYQLLMYHIEKSFRRQIQK
ncbi:hypothetical protein MHK_006411 [Candidatus Magnetomorum sp. HK-1]|nr:hypothetical protein MHK_006411 [Candidatus Magnetomorum sp. HK-1]